MSTVQHAYKCDRCGALFTRTKESNILNIRYTQRNITKDVDLCDNCTDDVLLLLQKKPLNPSDILEEA